MLSAKDRPGSEVTSQHERPLIGGLDNKKPDEVQMEVLAE